MKNVLITLLIVLLSIAITFAVWMLSVPFARANAKRVGDIEEAYKVQDADIRISSYEWFYQQYEQIQATKRKAELATGSFEERGIKMVLADMISEYNSRASMTKTRGQWKPKDLPYQIDYQN